MKSIEQLGLTEEMINDLADQYLKGQQEQHCALINFSQTPIFSQIINTIIEKNIFLDEENFRYFPEKTLDLFHLDQLTEQDLIYFIDCLSNDSIIVPDKTYQEEDNPFENTISEKLGLHVFTMVGQGTCIQIYPASVERRV